MTDIRTADWKDFRAMDSSHQLPTARADPAVYEKSIETHPFIAQRVTLINADHGGRESLYVFGGGKSRPSQRVATAKRLKSRSPSRLDYCAGPSECRYSRLRTGIAAEAIGLKCKGIERRGLLSDRGRRPALA